LGNSVCKGTPEWRALLPAKEKKKRGRKRESALAAKSEKKRSAATESLKFIRRTMKLGQAHDHSVEKKKRMTRSCSRKRRRKTSACSDNTGGGDNQLLISRKGASKKKARGPEIEIKGGGGQIVPHIAAREGGKSNTLQAYFHDANPAELTQAKNDCK